MSIVVLIIVPPPLLMLPLLLRYGSIPSDPFDIHVSYHVLCMYHVLVNAVLHKRNALAGITKAVG